MAGAAYSEPPHNDYQVGQVWEYQTRKEDAGSLLRIQKIEEIPASAKIGPVYHISVIGVRFAGSTVSTDLQHLPVSRATLDASVTRQSSSNASFPDPSAGITEWRSAKGGVFTIPLDEIVASVEQMMRQAVPSQPQT